MLLGSVTPILLVIREIWRCYKAKRIGNWFAYYRETSVTFDKLSKEISKSAVKLIDELLKWDTCRISISTMKNGLWS